MDEKTILELVDKFGKSRLSELRIKKGDVEVYLSKTAPGLKEQHPEHSHEVLPPEAPRESSPDRPPAPSRGSVITSPIVATFYRSPAPDSPPFVEEGKTVEAGATLCILEAMKLMNALPAEYSCRILKILAQNGTLVEFGTPLFEVERL